MFVLKITLFLSVTIPYGIISYHKFQHTLFHIKIINHFINNGNEYLILSDNRRCRNGFCTFNIISKRFI